MLKALFAIGTVQLLAMVVLLARTKILALLLGPELVGILGIIDKVVAVLAQVASLSIPFAALRFLPRSWDEDRQKYFATLRAMSLTLVGLALLATIGGLLTAKFYPERFGVELRPYHAAVLIASLTIPVLVLFPFIQNALATRFGPHRAMRFYLAHAAVLALSGIVGAWWSGLVGIYALYAGSGAVLVAASLVRLNTRQDASIRLSALSPTAVAMPSEVWRFGLALLSLTFLTPYAALFLHYRVLSGFGPEAAGWMQAAMGISFAIRGALGAAHPVFLTPNVNRGGTIEARMEWAVRFQQSLCLLTGLVLPPLLLFPAVVMKLLYTTDFLPGAQFLFLFVLVEIVGLLAATYQSLVLAVDRLRFHVLQNVVAQLLAIAVGWIAIPKLGIAGAALAGLCAQAFLYTATTLFLSRAFSLTVPARTGFLSLYLVVSLLLAGLIGRHQLDWTWTHVFTGLTLYLVLVIGLLRFLTGEEVEKVRHVLRTLSARFLAAPGG